MSSNYKTINNGRGTTLHVNRDGSDYISVGKDGNDIMMGHKNRTVIFDNYESLFNSAERKSPLSAFPGKDFKIPVSVKNCVRIEWDDLKRYAVDIFGSGVLGDEPAVYFDGEVFCVTITVTDEDDVVISDDDMSRESIMKCFSDYFGIEVTGYHVEDLGDSAVMWVEYKAE